MPTPDNDAPEHDAHLPLPAREPLPPPTRTLSAQSHPAVLRTISQHVENVRSGSAPHLRPVASASARLLTVARSFHSLPADGADATSSPLQEVAAAAPPTAAPAGTSTGPVPSSNTPPPGGALIDGAAAVVLPPHGEQEDNEALAAAPAAAGAGRTDSRDPADEHVLVERGSGGGGIGGGGGGGGGGGWSYSYTGGYSGSGVSHLAA
jgi:hypothetical protein